MLTERRSSARFPLTLKARYKALKKSQNNCGVGQTIDISSSGVLIASEHPFDVGVKLEVAVEWPALLDGTVELLLVANGRVVRAREAKFALEFSSYEFRTTGRKVKPAAA